MTNTGTALRIAARSPQDEREVHHSVAGLITTEVGGLHTQWRHILETVKETLAGLEQACDSAIEAREAEVPGLIGTLIDRAENERAELERRHQLQSAAAEAEAEALRTEIHAQRTEIVTLRQQLDAALTERSKLQETFRLVQRALALGTPEHIPMAVERDERPASDGSAPAQPTIASNTTDEQADAGATPALDAAAVLAAAHPDAVEDITRVVEQVEAMYHLDMDSGRSGIEIVDALTTSLSHARSLVMNRWGSQTCDAQLLFDRQIGLLLEQQAGTAFGRHLGIAAYASRTPVPGGDVPAAS